MTEKERRRHARIDLERQVELEFFTEVYDKCQVKNISSGGMFILGKFPPELDDRCYINFTQTSQNTRLTLQAFAKVVRRNDEGIALEFTSMSFESLLSLEMILLYEEKEKTSRVEIKLPEVLPFEVSENTSLAQDKYKFFLDRNK